MINIIMFGNLLVTILMFRFVYLNNKTHSQRANIIDKLEEINLKRIGTREDLISFSLFSNVSYYNHLFALFLFRDPLKLYPTEIQELAK